MRTYTPDDWVVLEFDAPQLDFPVRKVFAGWDGGFAESNSWKLNSGITAVRIDDEGHYEFEGCSGSRYYCHFSDYRLSELMQNILSKWLKDAEQHGNTTIKILRLDEIVVC